MRIKTMTAAVRAACAQIGRDHKWKLRMDLLVRQFKEGFNHG